MVGRTISELLNTLEQYSLYVVSVKLYPDNMAHEAYLFTGGIGGHWKLFSPYYTNGHLELPEIKEVEFLKVEYIRKLNRYSTQ